MNFPLPLRGISLLLGVTAVILLATSELLSQHYGKTDILIEKRLLRTAALSVGLLFMFTLFMRIYQIIS